MEEIKEGILQNLIPRSRVLQSVADIWNCFNAAKLFVICPVSSWRFRTLLSQLSFSIIYFTIENETMPYRYGYAIGLLRC